MSRTASRLLGRVIALPLACVLALPNTTLACGQEPLERAKELYNEGSSLYSAADYNGAIERFTDALKIVTSEGSADEYVIRGALLLNIAQAHIHAYEVDADVGHLRAAKSIYQRFVDEAERGSGYDQADVDEARRQLDQLPQKIEEHDARTPKNDGRPTTDGNPPPRDDGPKEAQIVRTRSIGIGLVIAGSVAFAGGAGVLGWGTTFRRFAIQSVIDEGGDPDRTPADFTNEEKAYVDQQTTLGIVWMVAGGVAALVGGAGIGVGAWQLAKAKKMKKQSNAVALTPLLTRDLAGLSVSGRF
jgi:tetratricopeptide (TPR) repeat protein